MATYPGITTRYYLERADDAKATMTVTMKVSQWEAIRDALSSDEYEQWPLRAAITDLINKAHESFYHRVPDEK